MAKSAAATAAAEATRAARKARRAAQIADDEREERQETPAGEEAADIGALFEGLPQESDIRLYRKAKIGGKLEYCQSFVEAREFSEEGVADKWGPGTYRLIARVPDPKTGKPQFAQGRTKTFTIAERPGEAARGSARGPDNFQESMAMQMFGMMTGQMQMQQQMMLQSQESHRAMLAMMMNRPDSGSELIKLVLPMLVNKADPMDMALKMAELLKPAGPAGSMLDQLAVMEKFMELAQRGETPGNAPVWFQALKEVAPLIGKAMQMTPGVTPAALPPGQAPAPAPAPALPTGAASPVPPAPPVAIDTTAATQQPPDLLSELDRTMPFLVAAAARDRDVELQADWFLDTIPEVMFETLDAALAEPALLDQLGARYPAILVHRAWFDKFVAAVTAALQPEEEEEIHESAASADSPQ